MHYAFYNCSSLTSLDLSGWKIDGPTDMGYIFLQWFFPDVARPFLVEHIGGYHNEKYVLRLQQPYFA